jgi:DNA-binding transcriptional MerR regulator
MECFNSKVASRIVGVSLRQIQYWDEQGFIRPSVRLADGRGTKRLYSFSDLIQLKVVKNLAERGLSLRKIRRCVAFLGSYAANRVPPLQTLKYVTDGENLFVLTSDRNKILDVLNRQFVFSLAIGSLVKELNGEVRRVTKQPPKRVPRLGTSSDAKRASI